MTLDYTPGDWMQEILQDQDWRDDKCDKVEELIKRGHGPGWGTDTTSGVYDPINHCHTVQSLYMSQLAYSVPQARITSSRAERKNDALAAHHGLNRWLRETKFDALTGKLATDYLYSYAFAVTTMAPVRGLYEFEDPVWWPQTNRVAGKMSGWDRHAKSWEERRYSFHYVVALQTDLEERAKADKELPEDEREGWNLKAIEAMQENAGLDRAETTIDGVSGRKRGEVVYVELWEADAKIKDENTQEKGYNGVIRTFAYAANGDSVEIREPHDFWGPRGGPHTLIGTYYIPDSSMPLSVLQATWGQQASANVIARANNTSAAAHKEIVLTDDDELTQKIVDGQHLHVFTHDTLDKDRVVKTSFGGLSDQSMAQEMRAMQMLQDASGVTEAMKGAVTGDATATENAIAASGSSARQGFVIRQFYAGVEDILSKVVWYMVNDDRVRMPLGAEADRELGVQDAVLAPGLDEFGKPTGDGTVDEFDDMELSIEVGSMGRKTQAEREQRAMMKAQAVQMLASMQMQFPFIAGTDIAKDIAEDLGYPELPRRFNEQMAVMLAGLQYGQEGMKPAPAQDQPQPRVAAAQATAQRPPATSILPQHAQTSGVGSSATGTQNRFAEKGTT